MTDNKLNTIVDLHFPGISPRRPVPPRAVGFDKSTFVAMLRKLAAMKMETLVLYTALLAVEPFHASRATWRLILGSNQSSKTSSAALCVGRWAADCDPYHKFRHGKAKALAIGLDEGHLADPMGVKLFKPGAFKLVRDEQTNLYRFLRHDPNNPQELDPYDASMREKWIDAPPIIPPRLFASRPAMKNAAAGVPLVYDFITGKKLEFRTSGSKPKQGDQNQLGWIDEAIEHGDHFKQLCRSFMAVDGVGIWSATPENVSPYLWELKQRADKGDPTVFAVSLQLDDNFAIAKERKAEFKASLRTEEEVRIHYYGEFAIVGRRIYPLYDPQGIHGCEPSDVPLDATRYVFLDPGRQHCATVLVAVDREEQHRYVYHAWEIRNLSSAHQWAQMVKQWQGDRKFEAFVIDSRAGEAHSMAGGASIAEQYWQALVEAGVKPRIMGSSRWGGFFGGLPNVSAREEALCNWMEVRGGGPFANTPILQVVRGCCPELDRQIQYACTSSSVSDKRVMDQPQDLVTGVEYAASFNPSFHEPESLDEDPAEAVVRSFKQYQRDLQKSHRRSRPTSIFA